MMPVPVASTGSSRRHGVKNKYTGEMISLIEEKEQRCLILTSWSRKPEEVPKKKPLLAHIETICRSLTQY
jgi:hypothetical protein